MNRIYNQDMPNGPGERERLETELQLSRLSSAWDDLLATEGGRHLVSDILDLAGVERSTFYGDERSAFHEGRRSLACEIIAAYIAPRGAQIRALMMIEEEQRGLSLGHARSEDMEGMNDAD